MASLPKEQLWWKKVQQNIKSRIKNKSVIKLIVYQKFKKINKKLGYKMFESSAGNQKHFKSLVLQNERSSIASNLCSIDKNRPCYSLDSTNKLKLTSDSNPIKNKVYKIHSKIFRR